MTRLLAARRLLLTNCRRRQLPPNLAQQPRPPTPSLVVKMSSATQRGDTLSAKQRNCGGLKADDFRRICPKSKTSELLHEWLSSNAVFT